MITTLSVKRLKAGASVALVHDATGQRIVGTVVQDYKRKAFKSKSGTLYDIKDRSGWHWEREGDEPSSSRKARELPIPETRGRKKKNG